MSARRKPVTWRSGLEKSIQEDLTSRGVSYRYEEVRVAYTKPASSHHYTPDFILPNGIIVESKGLWDVEDRQKHKLLKAQHPDLDIRFVFTRSKSPIRKGSKTTYADVCLKMDIPYADKLIPQSWIDEPDNALRHAALGSARA